MEKDKQTGWKKTNRLWKKVQTGCSGKETNVLMFLEYIDDLYK